MTREQLEKVPFHWKGHVSMETEHVNIYMSDDGSLSFQDHQPYRNGKPYGEGYRTYSYKGRTYKNLDEFLNAILWHRKATTRPSA